MRGQRIARYEVLERLGGGGMGEVWKARDPQLQRLVAIKLLKAPAADGEERILEEARAASALNHPNICTIHEVGQEDGRGYIVMEYVEGRRLDELIPAAGMSEEEVLRYGAQIAGAVAQAHSRGIVHRDLKTQNVIVTPDGRAKVLDFGLAERLPREGPEAPTRTLDASAAAGTISGTLAWMAPEVLRGEASTPASDVWSLGVMLHAMAAGRLPFSGRTGPELIAAILGGAAPPLSDRVPPGLRRIIRRALAREPARRYASAGELCAALQAIGTADVDDDDRPEPRAVPVPSSLAPSIAVLPFLDLSPQRDQAYFCEGMAEEIINALSGIRGLRVAARTSSFALRGQELPATDIGRRLEVASVLEGSVRKAGNRLRITAQLINVEDGFQICARRFDRDMDDVFAVQDEIARAIAGEMDVTLGIDSGEPLVERPTTSLDAYNAYLRGRFLRNQKGATSRLALEQYQRAVSLDPGFARAHAGVADAFTELGDQGILAPAEAAEEARRALTRALELAPDLVDAHVALAWLEMVYDWDWAGAERHFLKALEAGPSSADANSRYGVYLAWIPQRFDEAVSFARKGVELAPTDEVACTWLGNVLYVSRRSAEAVEILRRAIELNRTSFHAHFQLGAALLRERAHTEAVEVLETAMQLGGRHPWTVGLKGHAYLAAGDRASAESCHGELVELAERFSARFFLATLSAALGDIDRAFEYFEEGYRLRDPFMIHLILLPETEPLRSDPRFAELVRRVGLPSPEEKRRHGR